MYNRYTPRSDGSYSRSRIENRQTAPQPVPQPIPQPEEKHQPPAAPPPDHSMAVGSFLRQLLPKEFDTGDLLIVMLLLLIAGDSQEERGNALLTLALYFFM